MRFVLAVLAFVIASAAPTLEATTSGMLTVSARVQADCVIRSPIALDFGLYDPDLQGDAPLDATGNVLSIACTKGSPDVTVALDDGQSYAGAHRNLRRAGGSDLVGYEIYTSADHSTVWNLVDTVSYVSTSSQPTTLPVYGRVLGGQKPHAGHYSDVLMAMVNF